MEENKRKRGPNTPEGKQRSRRNATSHGVFSQTPVLPLVEDEEEWRRLRRDVLAAVLERFRDVVAPPD